MTDAERLNVLGEEVIRLRTIQDILIDDVKARASKEVVDKIEAEQRLHAADIATLKAMQDDRSPLDQLLPDPDRLAKYRKVGAYGALVIALIILAFKLDGCTMDDVERGARILRGEPAPRVQVNIQPPVPPLDTTALDTSYAP